ncbi:glycosyltransferase family 2 protein [Pigmentiphaga soli]|uniref:Glycosyltransferase family 2 protein n=1 Tax=Pigmentiphaga soli TaxID=1007095 RepID=A0ABP8GVP9_9BURK
MRKQYAAATQQLTDFVSRLRPPPPVAQALLPRLTVVTPSYNQGRFLERTILSVLNQGYPNLEYIIIDGGSSDDSVDIIRRYAGHLAYWESKPDRGQSHAINKGFRRATGDYVCWQNSDDLFFPGALLRLGRAAAADWPPIVSGNLYLADADNRIFREVRYTPVDRGMLTVVKASIPNQSAIFRRDLLERYGALDEGKRYCMDLDLWSRLLPTGTNVMAHDAYGVYTVHDATKTVLLQDVLQRERSQIIEGIRRSGPRIGRPRAWSYRAAKVAAHVRQGDLFYLLEKAVAKLAGRDDWDAQ